MPSVAMNVCKTLSAKKREKKKKKKSPTLCLLAPTQPQTNSFSNCTRAIVFLSSRNNCVYNWPLWRCGWRPTVRWGMTAAEFMFALAVLHSTLCASACKKKPTLTGPSSKKTHWNHSRSEQKLIPAVTVLRRQEHLLTWWCSVIIIKTRW